MTPAVLFQVGREGYQDRALRAAGEGNWHRLAPLLMEISEKGKAEGGSEGQKPPTVLQTYTVALTTAKDLESWLGPVKPNIGN